MTGVAAVDVQQAHDMMEAGEAVLIDVREPAEYGAERIHGALNFPLSTFDPEALPVGGSRALVLQCGSGKRSAMALDRCRQAGVALAGHLAGGIGAWRAAGLPVVRIDPATGASNAALFAAAMLGDQPAVARALADFRARQTEEVARNDDPRIDSSSTGFA